MARTLEEGFEKALEWIVPLPTERNKAISHRDSVRNCFRNNFNCLSFFETGSFGNKTGVRHFSDTDYFAVCPPENLSGKSSYVLQKVKKALQTTFSRTQNIRINSPAVAIIFGKHRSENLEITPCFLHKMSDTPLGKKRSYAIPAPRGKWMFSSPQAHNAYVELHNKRLKGKLKPLIRLIKAWKFYQGVPISSFYLELRITKFFEDRKRIDYETDLYGIIKKLYDIQLANIRDPMKVSGTISACVTGLKKDAALSKLATAYSRTSKAYLCRNKNLDDCFYWWKMFFNGKFPSR